MKFVRWIWVNAFPLVVLAMAMGFVLFVIYHVAIPAHPVQGERQIRNSERLTRLETIIREGPRWTEEEHRAWVDALQAANPSLAVPVPE